MLEHLFPLASFVTNHWAMMIQMNMMMLVGTAKLVTKDQASQAFWRIFKRVVYLHF